LNFNRILAIFEHFRDAAIIVHKRDPARRGGWARPTQWALKKPALQAEARGCQREPAILDYSYQLYGIFFLHWWRGGGLWRGLAWGPVDGFDDLLVSC
jgi:hypothetical protein